MEPPRLDGGRRLGTHGVSRLRGGGLWVVTMDKAVALATVIFALVFLGACALAIELVFNLLGK